MDRRTAALRQALSFFVRLRRPMGQRHKEDGLECKVVEAQRAANAGRAKKVYAIARNLAVTSPAPIYFHQV